MSQKKESQMPKYYLISYYARLPKGGFGFSRTYYSVNTGKEFDIEEFEITMAAETGLKPNDIALISRVNVSVEEFNYNTNKKAQEIYDQHSKADLDSTDPKVKDEILQNMANDYVVKGMTPQQIADRYHLSKLTIAALAHSLEWGKKRDEWNNKQNGEEKLEHNNGPHGDENA